MMILRLAFGLLLLGALGGLGGCATTGASPGDPFESFNRAMFDFNDSLDRAIVKPVATGYKAVLPKVVRTGVTNFFANLGDLWIGINNVLQGKVVAGASDFGRFAINSTIGILGLIDVASNAGLEKHNEDFGQTLGRWGMGSGAYLVLPILGPSSFRDGFGRLFVDWRGNPLWYHDDVYARSALSVLNVVDGRANLLDASQLVEEAALDHYSYVRGAYLQRRRSLIYDGDPPRERDAEQGADAGRGAGAQAAAETPPAPVGVQQGEGRADAAAAPVLQAAAVQPQQAADAQAAEGARPRSYEPAIPRNYDAVLAVPLAVNQPRSPRP